MCEFPDISRIFQTHSNSLTAIVTLFSHLRARLSWLRESGATRVLDMSLARYWFAGQWRGPLVARISGCLHVGGLRVTVAFIKFVKLYKIMWIQLDEILRNQTKLRSA